MIKPWMILLLLCIATFCYGQNPLSINSIPDSLKFNAGAVILKQTTEIEIETEKRIHYHYSSQIAVLNQSGNEEGSLKIHLNPWNKISDFSGSIKDAQGKIVRTIKQADLKIYHAVDGYAFLTDAQFYVYKPLLNEFPFTVIYDYRIEERNSLAFPSWYPQDREGTSVLNSKLVLTLKNNYKIRIHEHAIAATKIDTSQLNQRLYEWEVSGLKAFEFENFSPPKETRLIHVDLAPVKFIYEGMSGNFSTWQEYGKWTYDHLLHNRDQLPLSTKEKVNALIKDIGDKRKKIAVIYQFMQKKTRYVNIQKGTGTIVPMSAEEVDRLGYGDCKGLVNYTKALLTAAGITAQYCELFQGNEVRYIQEDFPSVQGDHVLLCVPVEKDTIWLECTSNNAPAGFLGMLTGNRNAVVCSPEGGKIVQTKGYHYNENVIQLEGTFKLDSSGKVSGTLRRKYQGIYIQELQPLIEVPFQQRKVRVAESFANSASKVLDYQIIDVEDDRITREDLIKFEMNGYAAIRQSRILVPVELMKKMEVIPDPEKQRKNDVFLPRGFTKTTNTEWILPVGYVPDYLPKDIDIKNTLGEFHFHMEYKDNKIFLTKTWMVKEGIYEPTFYNTLVKMFREADYTTTLKFGLMKK